MTQKPPLNDTKEIFRKCGTCSNTFCNLLNREFGNQKEAEEQASALLAGGLLNTGHQCGMLWGSSLAVGAESFRRHINPDHAIITAIIATQHIMKSFTNRTNTINCREITGCDLTSIFGMIKLGLKTILGGMNNSLCFNLAEKWTPEAIQSANKGFSSKEIDLNEQQSLSCASEVVRKMGGSDEEIILVAGFAGGMGLSGNACGALAAAIWMNSLNWCKEHPGKTPPYFNNPDSKKTLRAFYTATDSEILCHKISGQYFDSISNHTGFIKNGGCNRLITVLAMN